MESPHYIKTLLKPNGSKPKGRKVWSVDLETVWLPFFTATNVSGDTQIPNESLGAPLRLAYELDGSVKFSNSGRPVIRVAKELQDNIKLVRENFVAGLTSFTQSVIENQPDEYRTQVETSQQAGIPIVERDRQALDSALIEQAAKVAQEAEAQMEAEAKPKAKSKDKELVTA
ncbi:MAG: hypothetical protein SVM79_06880 [Chloroflexota bacterium]|nr:hypothetical protein [Chloroflexota bacterium]